MINISESDPPSFWVENAHYNLTRLRAISITGQDESIAYCCYNVRVSQWCFYVQLHGQLPCYNIWLLSLYCTDVQGQNCSKNGNKYTITLKKKNPALNQPWSTAQACIEYSQKTARTKHSPDISAILLIAHIKSQILLCCTILSKSEKFLEILAKMTNETIMKLEISSTQISKQTTCVM